MTTAAIQSGDLKEAVSRQRLTANDLMERYKISAQTLWRWVKNGYLPRPHYLGQQRRWWEHEVNEWEDRQMRQNDPQVA